MKPYHCYIIATNFSQYFNNALHHLCMFCVSVDEYYVDEGCRRDAADDVVPAFQSKYSTAGVRCCSDDGTSCDTPSGFLCPRDDVTFDDAVALCEDNNGRLCSKEELLSDICCGTGGSCDNFAVWTSTFWTDYDGTKIMISFS